MLVVLRRRLSVLAIRRRGVFACRGSASSVDLVRRRRRRRRRAALGVPQLGVQLEVGLLQGLLDLRQKHLLKHNLLNLSKNILLDLMMGPLSGDLNLDFKSR